VSRHPFFHQLAHVGALLGERNHLLPCSNALGKAARCRTRLSRLRFEGIQGGGELREIRKQNAFLPGANSGTDARRELDGRCLPVEFCGLDCDAPSRDFRSDRFEIALLRFLIGRSISTIELDQYIIRLNPAAIFDEHCRHTARFEGLHNL
jgi:hypothetical protein